MSKSTFISRLYQSRQISMLIIRLVGAGSLFITWFLLERFSGIEKVGNIAILHSQLMFFMPILVFGKDVIAFRESADKDSMVVPVEHIALFFVSFFALLIYSSFVGLSYWIVAVSLLLSLTIYLSENFRIQDKLRSFSIFKFAMFNVTFSFGVMIWAFFEYNLIAFIGVAYIIYALLILGLGKVSFVGVRGFSVDYLSYCGLSGAYIYASASLSSVIIYLIYNIYGFSNEDLGRFTLLMTIVSLLNLIQSVVYTSESKKLITSNSTDFYQTYRAVIYKSVALSLAFLSVLSLLALLGSDLYPTELFSSSGWIWLLCAQLFNVAVGPVILALNLRGFEKLSVFSSCISLAVLGICSISTLPTLGPEFIYSLYVVILNVCAGFLFLRSRRIICNG